MFSEKYERFMSEKFKNFMSRCIGTWDSNRRYYYPKPNKSQLLTSNLSIQEVEDYPEYFLYKLSWDTKDSETKEPVSDGEMLVKGYQLTLERDVGYFTEEPTVCNVEVVDDDCIVLRTAYSGMNFREEIRLLEDDTIRLRQTLGFKDGSNKPFLYGSYLEERIN
jgi:hypothetical protein